MLFMQKKYNFYFIEGLVKVIVNVVLFENCKRIAISSFFKGKNRATGEVLNKAKV